ncbi:MAG: hypothetical protein QF442_03330 [Candidatus Peribacteraceae bacterium]|nr:hypothetical protein [Candidatus Peribacteraceae bacterium]
MSVRREIEDQVGYNASGEERREAYNKLMVEKPKVDLVLKLSRVTNSLTWNQAGLLWNDVFDTEYSWERFLEDEAEFAKLQNECDELLAQID